MSKWERVRLGEAATQRKDVVVLQDGDEYLTMGVRWYGRGAYDRGVVTTETVKAKRLYRAHEGDFVFNRIDTQKGAFDVVPAHLDGALATNEFPLYRMDSQRLLARFALLYFQQATVLEAIDRSRAGSEGRSRWKETDFEAWRIPLPTLDEQRRIVDAMAAVDAQIEALIEEAASLQVLTCRRREELVNDPSVPIVLAEEAFEFSAGVRRTPDRASGNHMVPYLRSANVGYGALDLTDVQEMNYEPHEQVKFALRFGDVLVSEGSASPKAVGLPAMWRDDIAGTVCFQMTLLRLRARAEMCTPGFLFQWAMWAYESGRFLDVAGGTSIKHISAKRSSKMPVHLPDASRQREITTELEALADQLFSLRTELGCLRDFRSTLLSALLSQEIAIPGSYDELLPALQG